MNKFLMQSMSRANVNNLLTTAFLDASKSSEIVHELSRKIQYITMSLSVFKDALSLDLGEDGLASKIFCLDLLIKFIKEQGVPFVCQINDSEFLKALELCYNEHFELKKRIVVIINSVSIAIGFDKDNLELEEYYKFVKRINPNFKWIAREPASDFENFVHQALRILRLCKDTNEALKKPSSKHFNREEQISRAIKTIKTLHTSTDLFKSGFKPIELELIEDIILYIDQFEEDFLNMSTKVQKNVEKVLLQIKHPQKSEMPKNFESEEKLQKRTYFVYNENLIPDEGEKIEYKEYYYPFNEELIKTLKKEICAFLNTKGGRIYIGVNDEKMVYGLILTSTDRDKLRREILNMLNGFYPTIIHEDFVKVHFLQVKDNNNEAIRGRVVVKIIVKPGDRDKLYSITKNILQCFIRKDGFCHPLNAEETDILLKKKSSQSMDGRIDPREFDDPEPDTLAEIEDESAAKKPIKQVQISNQPKDRKEEEKKQEVSLSKKLAHQNENHDQVVKTKPEKNKLAEPLAAIQKSRPKNHGFNYGFKLTGLPTDTTEEEIVSLFRGVNLASKPNVIRDIEGKCIGRAYINFYDSETGNNEAKRINRGEKKLRGNTLNMVFQTNSYGFRLSGLPTDTTEEEIVSLFQGVNLASKPNVIRDKESGECTCLAYINFYDLETGNNEAKKINIGEKKLRENTLNMAFQIKPYGFKLTGLPSDTTEEEIVSLFPGVNLASKPKVIRDKEGKCTGLAYINFYDLETGTKAAERIHNKVKLRNNILKMVAQSR